LTAATKIPSFGDHVTVQPILGKGPSTDHVFHVTASVEYIPAYPKLSVSLQHTNVCRLGEYAIDLIETPGSSLYRSVQLIPSVDDDIFLDPASTNNPNSGAHNIELPFAKGIKSFISKPTGVVSFHVIPSFDVTYRIFSKFVPNWKATYKLRVSE
jgi:hypothetical protein